jgi:hypothetical protein
LPATSAIRASFEAPVRVDYKFSSQIGIGSVLRIALDTAAIFYRLYVLGSYRDDVRGIGPCDRSGRQRSSRRVGARSQHPCPEKEAPPDPLPQLAGHRNPDAGGAEVFHP